MPALESRTITLWIDRPSDRVYAFASSPENLVKWASGLGDSIRQAGDDWQVQGPSGLVTLQFAPPNAFGVLDHRVLLPSGDVVEVPMRVIPNGTGSELQFTLFRQPDMSQERFEDDARWVERDLHNLKRILEA
ncbi:hypothetical protein D3C86_1411950 [compost metagenome]